MSTDKGEDCQYQRWEHVFGMIAHVLGEANSVEVEICGGKIGKLHVIPGFKKTNRVQECLKAWNWLRFHHLQAIRTCIASVEFVVCFAGHWPFDLIHADLFGHFIQSLGGKEYYIIFTDSIRVTNGTVGAARVE